MVIYLALASGILIYLTMILFFWSYGQNYERIRKRVAGFAEHTPNILDEELRKPLAERIFKPTVKVCSTIINYFQKYLSAPNSKNQQSVKLKKMLHKAGMSISTGAYSFICVSVLLGTAVLFGLVSVLLGLRTGFVLNALIGAYAGYVFMRVQISARITKRRRMMEQQLPDVLDLLSINVEAGLGFEQALLHVTEHFEGPIIDELKITSREMSMGRPRRDALAFFAERCELDEVKSFSGAMIQAEQLGISIKNVLRAQAAAMRTSRRNKVQEKAMKLSVKILLPMVGFIFPVLFIVLLGPAVVKIFEIFAG